jgi:hypothetical protein
MQSGTVLLIPWHATLEEGLSAAEFEYEGVSQTWNVV